MACKVSQTRDFDYRKVMNSDGVMDMDKLDCYFSEDLSAFDDKITTSDYGKYRTPTPVYAYTKKMKVWMIIALLNNTMNPNSYKFRLHCYAHGLRDAGFEIVNTFGCTCSIDHIRQNREYWTQERKACDELQPAQFWFAKNMTAGETHHKKCSIYWQGRSHTFLNDPTPYRDKTRVSESDTL